MSTASSVSELVYVVMCKSLVGIHSISAAYDILSVLVFMAFILRMITNNTSEGI